MVTTAGLCELIARYASYGLFNEYFQIVHDYLHIDGTVAGNSARFINYCCVHDFEACAVDLGVSGYYDPWLRAMKYIRAGDEIRSDYGWHNVDPDRLVMCNCGTST